MENHPLYGIGDAGGKLTAYTVRLSVLDTGGNNPFQIGKRL
jgi:hypothetical protein